MPRIPEAEIDRIKRPTDLAALVRSRGVELAQARLEGPYRPVSVPRRTRNPSFIVTPEKGLFHCMGCGAAGNPIQFVEKFDGVSFRHAFEFLNDGPAAFRRRPTGAASKKGTVPRLDTPLDPDG